MKAVGEQLHQCFFGDMNMGCFDFSQDQWMGLLVKDQQVEAFIHAIPSKATLDRHERLWKIALEEQEMNQLLADGLFRRQDNFFFRSGS